MRKPILDAAQHQVLAKLALATEDQAKVYMNAVQEAFPSGANKASAYIMRARALLSDARAALDCDYDVLQEAAISSPYYPRHRP